MVFIDKFAETFFGLEDSPMLDPLAVTVADACNVASSSRSEIYAAILRGELGARKRGRKTLILISDLRAWVEALPEFKNTAAPIGEAS